MSAEARRAPHHAPHFERLDAVLVDITEYITEYIAAIGAVLDRLDSVPMTAHAALLDAPTLIRWLLALHQPLESLCAALAADAQEASVHEALDALAV